MDELTQLLHLATTGNAQASHRLFDLLYADLKQLARYRLHHCARAGDLSTTALVHESFLRLIEGGRLRLADRPAFLGYVGRVMRNVVVDHIRRRLAAKRGGNEAFVTLTTGVQEDSLDDERILAVNAALDTLERIAPEFHRLVEMRYFAGLSVQEVAEVRGVSTRTVEREWEKARAFLHKLMNETE